MLDYGRTFMGDMFLTPTAYGPWVDVAYYDEDDLADETVINSALLVQSTNTVLSISKPYSITNNITIPDTMIFAVVNQGALVISSGITFTCAGICLTNGRIIHSGSGTMKYGKWIGWSSTLPEGYLYAKPGSVCFYNTTTAGKLYVKESGNNTNTGWVVK
jgi:hypothetical protein